MRPLLVAPDADRLQGMTYAGEGRTDRGRGAAVGIEPCGWNWSRSGPTLVAGGWWLRAVAGVATMGVFTLGSTMSNHRIEEVETIPVVQEQLQVSRQAVETGRAVRLRKQVHEEPVDISQELAQEVVETRRVPIDRVIDGPVGIRQEGDVTIIPVLAERLVTHTELVLVEEIHIRRHSELRQQTGQASLRRESVVVERFDPETQRWVREEES